MDCVLTSREIEELANDKGFAFTDEEKTLGAEDSALLPAPQQLLQFIYTYAAKELYTTSPLLNSLI